MKTYLTFIILLLSFNSFAQSKLTAIILKDLNILSINISDDRMLPPFEAGTLWQVLKGIDQRKSVNMNGFKMECYGFKNNLDETFGSCTINIQLNLLQRIGNRQVFKLSGASATQLNHYFTDSAYVSLQGGQAYLSSYNTRQKFYFGIEDNLIQK